VKQVKVRKGVARIALNRATPTRSEDRRERDDHRVRARP
jgi:hypothetical protein